MLVGIRKSPPLPILCAMVKLWAGVTPKCTPKLQNAQQKQNTKYLERESEKLNPNGMQNKSPKHILSHPQEYHFHVWHGREGNEFDFFRVSIRPNVKPNNHFCTLPWCLYSPRKKDFAAELHRLVLMTLTLSSTGVTDAGMWAEIYHWSQLNLELPVAACPHRALTKQLNEGSGSNIPLNIHQGRHRHLPGGERGTSWIQSAVLS